MDYSRLLSIPRIDIDGITQQTQSRLSSMKSWADFFDRKRFSRPESLSIFTTRMQQNVLFFQNNYILVCLLLTAYVLYYIIYLSADSTTCFFCSPLSSLLSSLNSSPQDHQTRNSAFSAVFHSLLIPVKTTQRQLWIVFAVLAVILLWLSNIGSTLFYLLFLCALIVSLHAGFMEPPIETEFQQIVV
jgi:hypothetical protein